MLSNDERKIQKYLEENPLILVASIGTPNWFYNYVLPQFKLGSDYVADFLIVTGIKKGKK